jgi:hypothetical protein
MCDDPAAREQAKEKRRKNKSSGVDPPLRCSTPYQKPRTAAPVGPATTFEKEQTMRVMVIVKANAKSEAGVMPSEKLLTDMGKYNEELVKAGIMLAGDGLHPSAKAKRIRFAGGKKTVIDGPFSETKELVAGFWIWQVKSMEEAVEWAKRCPSDPTDDEESFLELRPVFEAEDFGAELTPALREQEARLRSELERKRS